jgi:hypothetical protein
LLRARKGGVVTTRAEKRSRRPRGDEAARFPWWWGSFSKRRPCGRVKRPRSTRWQNSDTHLALTLYVISN